MTKLLAFIDQLEQNREPLPDIILPLLQTHDFEAAEYLRQRAEQVRQRVFGNKVYLRGLIEISSYCRNDCYYCGIRRGNKNAQRYRLTEEQILDCCRVGYGLGFRTFVLQGGEDACFTVERLTSLVRQIRAAYPDCAITLSLGEMERDAYQALFDAGANRYLLRHETANEAHYALLHPPELTLRHRLQCLQTLKEIGFQVGCGMMVGSPGQRPEYLLEDLQFLAEFQPHMVGIGPFIPHHDTPFARRSPGTAEDTCRLLSIVRLLLPSVLLPATTALGTILAGGRELGVRSGANVVMPNLSPQDVRDKYLLYDNKLHSGGEAAEGLKKLRDQMADIGYETVQARGDHPDFK